MRALVAFALAWSASLRAQPDDAGLADAGTPTLESTVQGQRASLRDGTAPATTVSGEVLRQSPRATLFEALAQQAGDVYVPSRGAGLHGVANGATGGIFIRGLGGSPNSQVLVVEDSVPDYQGIFGHPLPDAYAPALLEEVALVKGGDSVLYGTNALGGAVVLTSRWREREGLEATVDAAGGSFTTLRGSASVLGRAGPWDLALAASALTTEGHRPGAGGSTAVVTTAARLRLGLWRLTLRNKVMHVSGADPGPVTHPTPARSFEAWRDTASLKGELRSGPVRFTALGYANLGLHRLYDGFRSTDVVAGVSAEGEWAVAPGFNLLGGLAGELVAGAVENRVTLQVEDVRPFGDASLYAQLTARPVPEVLLLAGARAVVHSRFGPLAVYKAGARWEVGHGLSLKAHAGTNFRQPTLRELYLPYPVANPDLKPEYAFNADLSVAYRRPHLEVTLSGYRTQAWNLIRYFGVWPAAEVVNIDQLVVYGVEGRVGLTALGPLSGFITGDWQSVGVYTRQNPAAKVNASLEARHTFGPHQVQAAVSAEWVHGLYMANYARQPLPDVFVLDATLRYSWSDEASGLRLEPYLVLRNLLNGSYAYVTGYVMPGFNVMAGLKAGL